MRDTSQSRRRGRLTGEREVLKVNRHWLAPVGEILLSAPLMLIMLFVVLLAALELAPGSWLLPLCAGSVVAGLWIGIPMLRWTSTSLVVTDSRVIIETGVLNRVQTTIAFDAIQAVGTRQSIAGRVFGYGTIHIGTSVHPSPVSFRRVPLDGLRDQLLAAMSASGRQRGPDLGIHRRPAM